MVRVLSKRWMYLLQWAVYVIGSLAVLVAGSSVLGGLIVTLMGLNGTGLLLVLTGGTAFGAIWGVLSINVWIYLAERGWFV